MLWSSLCAFRWGRVCEHIAPPKGSCAKGPLHTHLLKMLLRWGTTVLHNMWFDVRCLLNAHLRARTNLVAHYVCAIVWLRHISGVKMGVL